MATSTQYKDYIIMSAGEFSGQWGDPQLNENFIEIADRNIGGALTKSLSSSNVTLTTEESQNLILRLTGTLSANVQVTTSCQGMTIVENLTSGSFSVTFTDGVGSVVIPQSSRALVITDAANGARIAASEFPSGTSMFFAQTAAPTGWTKDTANYNEHAIRIVTGSASNGGSVNFTTAFMSQTPGGTVGNTVLTIDQIPAHTHTYSRPNEGNRNTGTGAGNIESKTDGVATGSTGGGQSHTHTFTGNAMNLAVKYLDCILAVKD